MLLDYQYEQDPVRGKWVSILSAVSAYIYQGRHFTALSSKIVLIE
jgi:hypothetical protein